MSNWDVLIVGGGPAGCAAGNLLAQAGARTLVLEGGAFPRHHIGESLLPASMPVLERLGVGRGQLSAGMQHKFGARFYDAEHDDMASFDFDAPSAPRQAKDAAEAPVEYPPSYQVERAIFDEWLLDAAVRQGCQVRQKAVVAALDEDAAEPTARLADGTVERARFLIDASGQRALLAGKRQTRQLLPNLGRVAVYSYFENLAPHDVQDPRYITMYIFEGGWFWLIPLADGRTSVGVVLSQRALAALRDAAPQTGGLSGAALFAAAVRQLPRLERRMRAARRVEPWRAVTDYSYRVRERTGPRFALIGDAAGFLDPIFSSGVHMGLMSAQAVAPAVLQALDGDGSGLAGYSHFYARGYRVFETFVDRFYNRGLLRNVFFTMPRQPDMRQALIRLLAGYVWDETNPLVQMAVRATDPLAESPAAESA